MFLYEHDGAVYLNITNRCPVACAFCVKSEWGYDFHGQDLRLGDREPTTQEVIAAVDERLRKGPQPREIVFCGFGEPTMRSDTLVAVASHIRTHANHPPIRLNTVGLGNLVNGRDIVPDLARVIDRVSVSLNTNDPAQWQELHRAAPAWRAQGFQAVREFIALCAKAGLKTRVTAVQGIGSDLSAVADYAKSVGADFLARPALEDASTG